MKPAVAKTMDPNALEDIGRATLQIVHDLKNQLNGIKLYATFLRRRLEAEEWAVEERETLAKLIAGLDRAAADMTRLSRYAQPLELRRRAYVDLRKIISNVVNQATTRDTGGLPRAHIATEIEAGVLFGEFDPAALTEALKAVTDEVLSSVSTKDASVLSLNVSATPGAKTPEALIEWRANRLFARNQMYRGTDSCETMRTNLARKIVEAHGGRIECDADVIRVWLPLSNDA